MGTFAGKKENRVAIYERDNLQINAGGKTLPISSQVCEDSGLGVTTTFCYMKPRYPCKILGLQFLYD